MNGETNQKLPSEAIATMLKVKEEFEVKSFKDARKKVNRLIVSFITIYGTVYNRSFEYPVKYSYTRMMNDTPKSIIVNPNL